MAVIRRRQAHLARARAALTLVQRLRAHRRALIRVARNRPHLRPHQVVNLVRSRRGLPRLAPARAARMPGARIVRLARARPALAPHHVLRVARVGAQRRR